MLILTRRMGEAIRIGDDVVIVIKELGRTHVRLGIDAPKHVKIRRLETLGDPSETSETEGEDT